MLNKKLFFLFSMLIVGFTISASTAFAGTPIVVSVKIINPNTVVIYYSEPVYTTLNDYGTFSGSLAGQSLSALAGSGTNVVTLAFSNSTAFQGNATGGMNISSNVKSVSDNSPLGGGPYNVVDGQAPLLSAFSFASNLAGNTVAKTGDGITVTFNANEAIYAPAITIAGHSVSVSGSGNGPYTGYYVLTSSDTQDIIPATASFTDIAGNTGSGSFVLGGGVGPKISSITSNANSYAVLRAGDTINFVMTLATALPNAVISGSYNDVPLTWTTSNGGATYTAIYTVKSGDASSSIPIQITNVVVRDSSGNASLPVSGTDVQKIINSHSFVITEISSIPSVSNINNPKYGFSSPQEGTITFGGDCNSVNQSVMMGNNYVTFNPLSEGLHTNCTITVVDGVGYSSNILNIAPFTISTGSTSTISASSQTVAPPSTPTTTSNSIYNYKFYNPLKVGSKGNDVLALQKRLNAEGVYFGPYTGTFGSLTQAAVKKYQKAHGLSQLGSVGPGTRSALNK